jgi:spermidine/putrescine transport system substrate-binding protein
MKKLLLIAIWLAVGSLAHAAPPALHLLCWTEYVPKEVIDGFSRETGAVVEMATYHSNEQMLALLRARPGWYDLVQPSGFYVQTLAEGGELEPLDRAKLSHFGDLDPHYLGLPFDPENRDSVPWMAGTVGIVVDTARVPQPVKTWAEVFDGTHAGKIVVVDDAREMVAWALASLGRPITEVDPAALAAVKPVLTKWLPQVKVFDSDSPGTALLDGRAEIGIVWSGEAALLWQKDHRFRYVLPAEGAHRFVDSLAIPHGAPDKEAALQFIDYCLRPEVSVRISKAYPYTNPNAAARRLLTPEELANPASYPPGDPLLPMLHNEGGDTKAVEAFVGEIRRGMKR